MILQREAEERPYLVPYFEKIDDKKAAFIIENVGRTPALSVKLAVVGKDPNNSPFPFPFNQEIPVIAPASPLLAMAYEYEINYELEMVLKLEYYSSEGKRYDGHVALATKYLKDIHIPEGFAGTKTRYDAENIRKDLDEIIDRRCALVINKTLSDIRRHSR